MEVAICGPNLDLKGDCVMALLEKLGLATFLQYKGSSTAPDGQLKIQLISSVIDKQSFQLPKILLAVRALLEEAGGSSLTC